REAEGRLAETAKGIAEEEAKRKAEEAARAAADNTARSTKAAAKPMRPPASSDDFRRQLEKSAQETKGYGVGY
ncbi:MAG: hypothetical protein J6333_12905, partial [Planctomycetes bacterium]|nr:hypothetical protein [Planctomycetota bacterium]